MLAPVAAMTALLLADPSATSTGGAATPATGAAVERFRGEARTRDGALAYVETHEVRLSGGTVLSADTRYESPDGRAIARLTSAYAPGSFAPEYEFKDLRTGAREAVRHEPSGLRLLDGEKERTLPFPGDVPVVAGQGLDRFARAHLDRLAAGETLRVSLALPGRLDAFGFRLRGERLESGLVRVRFEPTSFLLRMLAPALEGDYDPATRRLVRYVGVSNVAAEDGSTQQVEIAYSYLDPQRS